MMTTGDQDIRDSTGATMTVVGIGMTTTGDGVVVAIGMTMTTTGDGGIAVTGANEFAFY